MSTSCTPADSTHGAHAAARDHAGTGATPAAAARGPAPKRPVTSCGIVPVAQRHAHQVLARAVDALADRLGHLAGLAQADADHAVAVADHDQRAEAEAAAALHDLRHAVDVDHAVRSSS